MRLDEYQWSHNPRGLHNSDSPKAIDVERVLRLHCGWVKLVSVDREHIPAMPLLLGNNITPIVRVFRPHFGAGAPTADMIKAWKEYYQAGAGPRQPRPPEAERADDGGWHFEYPFDPITQANSPGLTPVSGGPDFPRGDPLGLSGMGYAFMKKFGEMFGGGAVPVVGTE